MLRPVAPLLLALSVALPVSAREPGPIKKLSLDPDAPVVEFFAATVAGQLDVRLVPLDENGANVFVENTTDATLTVATPPTIALVSVHPQFQPPAGLPTSLALDPTGLQTGNGQSTAGQFDPSGQGQFPSLLNGQPGGANNPFAGNNFFSIPPHRSVWLKVNSVCLDHGRPSPRPKMPYVLVPVETRVDNPVLRRLLADFDPAKDDRTAVQAAAWHLSNDLDWKTLAALTVKRGNLDQPRFTREQLEHAWNFVDTATKRVDAEEAAPVNETSNETASTRTTIRGR